MAITYEPIATTTLGSATNSITFSSISASYTDLRIVFFIKSVNSDNWARIRFNGDTTTNYGFTYLTCDGTTNSASQSSASTSIIIGYPSNVTPGFITIDIPSYAGSSYKSCLIFESQNNDGSGQFRTIAGVWTNGSAINSIELYFSGLTFSAGTMATLYGILKA